jgi:hypothetical protein
MDEVGSYFELCINFYNNIGAILDLGLYSGTTRLHLYCVLTFLIILSYWILVCTQALPGWLQGVFSHVTWHRHFNNIMD